MSIDTLFAALANRSANNCVFSDGPRQWSAPEVLDEIGRLQHRLSGVHTLAVLADNSPAWAMADLAALRAGITHVPLPGFFSPTQIAHVLEQTGADTVLSDQPERITALQLGFKSCGEWQGLSCLQRASLATSLPAGTAKVSFTSGSTGNPKGACLSADGLLDTAIAVSARLADLPIQRHLAVLPLALLLENSAGVYAPLLRGSTVLLPPLATLGWHGMAGFDPVLLHASVGKLQAHSVILVPELLKAWHLLLAATQQRAPASLVFAAVGGARVETASLQAARALGLPAYQGYGLTECGSVVSLNRPGDDGEGVGRPLDHVRITIDEEKIQISARAFLGYLGTPPLAATDSMQAYATGDLGHLDATGHLHLSGRSKNLLITSFGRNISPEWVEAALLAQPEILQAVVGGDACPFLHAVLVPMPGVNSAALERAVARANATLPDYARLGGWIISAPFTPMNGQATGNGRPLRTAIHHHHAAAIAALYEKEETHELL